MRRSVEEEKRLKEYVEKNFAEMPNEQWERLKGGENLLE
jgi:hypothetical protein